jgi:hypothetical protein
LANSVLRNQARLSSFLCVCRYFHIYIHVRLKNIVIVKPSLHVLPKKATYECVIISRVIS